MSGGYPYGIWLWFFFLVLLIIFIVGCAGSVNGWGYYSSTPSGYWEPYRGRNYYSEHNHNHQHHHHNNNGGNGEYVEAYPRNDYQLFNQNKEEDDIDDLDYNIA